MPIAKKKLFHPVADAERKGTKFLLCLTTTDAAEIRRLAAVRQLSISDFVRRAALGRKADVDYETEIVLVLSEVVRSIRALHASMLQTHVAPPEELLRPVIEAAIAAMLRITK